MILTQAVNLARPGILARCETVQTLVAVEALALFHVGDREPVGAVAGRLAPGVLDLPAIVDCDRIGAAPSSESETQADGGKGRQAGHGHRASTLEPRG